MLYADKARGWLTFLSFFVFSMARACIDDNESHVVSFALIYTLASKDAFCTMEWMELKDLAKSPVTWWVARALISCCATMSKFSICFVPFKVAYGLCSPVQLLPEIVDLGESLARGAQGGRLDVVQLQKKKIIFFFLIFHGQIILLHTLSRANKANPPAVRFCKGRCGTCVRLMNTWAKSIPEWGSRA